MQCKKRKLDDDYIYFVLGSDNDGVLRTEDGGKFKINRSLLASQSPFFKALFTGNFGDRKDALLKGIDADTLDSVLIYLYTGTIDLSEENAIDILVASDYLLIDPLMQESKTFVLKKMTLINCIPLFLEAWHIEKLNILISCHRFIVIHFEEFVLQSEEVGSLPLEALKKILKEKSLNISDERTVWNAIVKWIEFEFPDRLRFVPELLKYISFQDADNSLVNDIYFHNLIQKNKFCRELLLSELKHTDKVQHFRQIISSNSYMIGSRIPTKLHLIFHYCITNYSFERNIYLTFDGEKDYWRKVGSVFYFPDYIIHMDGYVYMFTTSIQPRLSLAFDLFEEKCVSISPIHAFRCCYSVVSVNGFIYILGGFSQHFNRVDDVERFDPKTGNWELVSPMPPMFYSRAVALNGYIYAIGHDRVGTNSNVMVQVYDPASDRWSFVSAPSLSKLEITAIAHRQRLYLVSGEILCCSQRSMEEYDPVKDVWTPMPDLPVPYLAPRATVLQDVLIVYEADLARITWGQTSPPVYWDPENHTWHIIKESSPVRMIHLYKFCTITDPRVIRSIVKRNRHQSSKWVKSPLA